MRNSLIDKWMQYYESDDLPEYDVLKERLRGLLRSGMKKDGIASEVAVFLLWDVVAEALWDLADPRKGVRSEQVGDFLRLLAAPNSIAEACVELITPENTELATTVGEADSTDEIVHARGGGAYGGVTLLNPAISKMEQRK